jgi:NADPH:quinone reductase-like Zn-dependent oxidoreductase
VIVENQLKVPQLGKNMKTIFITGASSGLGKATAKLFSAKGWSGGRGNFEGKCGYRAE